MANTTEYNTPTQNRPIRNNLVLDPLAVPTMYDWYYLFIFDEKYFLQCLKTTDGQIEARKRDYEKDSQREKVKRRKKAKKKEKLSDTGTRKFLVWTLKYKSLRAWLFKVSLTRKWKTKTTFNNKLN